MKFDKIDAKMLSIIQEEGRISNAELAKRIGISPPPTSERLKKLEANGIIQKYAALLNASKLGMKICTYVEISLSKHGKNSVNEFMNAVMNIDEVMECHHTTGDSDFLLKIVVPDIQAYETLVLNKLTDLPYIQNLKTKVVLSTLKHKTAFNIQGD
jgi:DNA-binding Lrp family transcriptional regulator